MRVLQLIPTLSGGGAETQLGYLAPELALRGHQIHIAYSKEGPNGPKLPGVLLEPINGRSNYDPLLLWHLVRLTRRIKPDIIHTWILQMDILGGLVGKLTGIPWLFREPSCAKAYPPTWKTRLRVVMALRACAIVANSIEGDDYWKRRLPNSRRYIVPNGLPAEEIERTVAAAPSSGNSPGTPIILYVGRLTLDGTAAKNLKALLEAAGCVRKRRRIRAILCGEGPHRAELVRLRHTLGLDEDVDFPGFLPPQSIWALMKTSSVFVSLSAYEGCPNAVMEAMAAGCPLIVSDIPAHRQILDKSSALFVNPSNVEETAEAILKTVSDPEASKNRTRIAKERTKAWSISEMARNWERVYEECLNQRKVHRFPRP